MVVATTKTIKDVIIFVLVLTMVSSFGYTNNKEIMNWATTSSIEIDNVIFRSISVKGG